MLRSKKIAALFISVSFVFGIFQTAQAQVSVVVAKPTNSVIYVDGAEKSFTAYNISGNNYFKLRDLAYVVNGSEKEFNVVWQPESNSINLVSGQAYQPAGGEMYIPEKKEDKAAKLTSDKILVNGQPVDFSVYNIDGSNYFKLRDVLETFNIGVTWNQVSNAIEIDTSENYKSTAAIENREEKELTAQEVYNKHSSAIFYIETYDMNKNPLYSGSGFFIDGQGKAVTNYHVLEDAFYATITLTNNTTFSVEGVLGYDIDKDVAIIKIDGKGFPYLNMGNSNKMTGGEQIYTIGSPYGLSNTITEGIISNPNRSADGVKLIQISAPISSGSSGGALLNTKGEVIGITSSAIAEAQNLNFAVAIEEVKGLILKDEPANLGEVAAEKELYVYKIKPISFQYIEKEIEPNNTAKQAQHVDNGVTIEGKIDDIYLDDYYVRCNTTGTIEIFCTSESPYFEDIMIIVDDLQEKAPKGASFITMEKGLKWLYINYEVTEPNIYTISLFSSSELKDISEDIPYLFYYEFTPKSADKGDEV